LLFLFVFSPLILHSQYIFTGTPPEKVSLHPYAQLVNLGNQNISIEQILKKHDRLDFKPVASENADLGFSQDNYWVKFTLENQTPNALEYYLETARPITDYAELYTIRSNGKISKAVSGDHVKCSERSYCHRKTIFRIDLLPNEKQQIFIHLKSDGEVLALPLLLRTSENLMEITAMEQLTFGVFYGILLIAAIIYMFFFFGLRERTFIYYSLYVVFIGLLQFSLDGYFYQYFTPGGGWFSQRSVLIFATISAFLLGRYSQIFLKIKDYDRILNRMFDVVYGFLGLLFLSIVLSSDLKYCYPAANVLGLLILILIIASVLRLYYKKVHVDKFFATGIIFLIIGFVIFIMNNFGQIPTSFMSQNSSKFGTGLEVIFLSLSMANLIAILKNEKEEFNRLALARSEEMNEMKSYFLSNISHELRTPLNAIMSLSTEMAKNSDDKKVRKKSQIIKYSSHSLLSSVNDILDFSKIEKGELILESVQFDPGKVLEHIKNNAEIRAKDQGLDFEFSKSESLPEMLYGDVTRLAQIVNIVLSNEIKFTPEGTVRFTVDCEPRPANRTRLLLAIKDTGVGIPKEKITTIFESFTQDNINNKRKFGGLGLGLYIVKTLVDMQRGQIKMESKVGEGTCCKIWIDYDIVEVPKHPDVISEQIFDLQGKSILVVEDNAINQMVIKMITKKWLNTTVSYAVNGFEGLEALRQGHFDIVLMDLQMPVMDGYEATIAIRNGETGSKNSNIPIIAVTADVMETTKQTVKDIGMNHYLSKPLKNEVLFDAIKALV
jgi:signal transduction histidine kinase/ActR/RegA family two-component response regulator